MKIIIFCILPLLKTDFRQFEDIGYMNNGKNDGLHVMSLTHYAIRI